MILSSFIFEENLTLYCIFAMRLTLFEETHFFILSRLGFIFDGFCACSLELPALRGWGGS